jgi:hypothetical protein
MKIINPNITAIILHFCLYSCISAFYGIVKGDAVVNIPLTILGKAILLYKQRCEIIFFNQYCQSSQCLITITGVKK